MKFNDHFYFSDEIRHLVRLKNPKTELDKQLGDILKENPQNVISEFDVGVRMFMSKKHAVYQQDLYQKFFVSLVYRTTKTCLDLESSPSYFASKQKSYALSKNSPYTEAFNREIMHLWETGLPQFWLKNSPSIKGPCFQKRKKQTATQKPLRLVDLTSVFAFLGFSVSFSLIVFFIELVIGHLVK